MKSRGMFLAFLAVFMPALAFAKKEAPISVGVLSFPGSLDKEQQKPLVRFGFVKKDNWEVGSLTDLPKSSTWNIAFDGKNLGPISAKTYKSNLYLSKKSLQVETDTKKIKKFDNSKRMFGSWMGYDRFRPMVVVSEKNTKDPEAWKPGTSDVVIGKAKSAFIKKIKEITICDEETYEVKKKLKVSAKQVSFIKGYRNKLGEHIVGLQLPDYFSTTSCDGLAPDNFEPHWFYIIENKTQLIGTRIAPVDAGDYDNDGRSEWIFQISRYNEDGYGMFPLKTKKMLEFTWGYH